ncbi:hypothetical protein Emag_000552 [Eimeria magna]
MGITSSPAPSPPLAQAALACSESLEQECLKEGLECARAGGDRGDTNAAAAAAAAPISKLSTPEDSRGETAFPVDAAAAAATGAAAAAAAAATAAGATPEAASAAAAATAGGEPRLLVIAGPSGVGKGTLVRRLRAHWPTAFGFSVSHTTRKPRAGETPGRDYYFVDLAEIKRMQAEGQLLEVAEFSGNLYATSIAEVNRISIAENSSLAAAAAAAAGSSSSSSRQQQHAAGGVDCVGLRRTGVSIFLIRAAAAAALANSLSNSSISSGRTTSLSLMWWGCANACVWGVSAAAAAAAAVVVVVAPSSLGRICLLEIDLVGVKSLRSSKSDLLLLLLLLLPARVFVLYQIARRLAHAREELEASKDLAWDLRLLNDDVDSAWCLLRDNVAEATPRLMAPLSPDAVSCCSINSSSSYSSSFLLMQHAAAAKTAAAATAAASCSRSTLLQQRQQQHQQVAAVAASCCSSDSSSTSRLLLSQLAGAVPAATAPAGCCCRS